MLYDVLRRVKNEVNIMMWLTIILALLIVSGVYTYARYTYHTEVTGVTVTVPGIGYCAYNGMTLADCVLVTDADEPYETVSVAKTAIESKTEVTSFSEISETDEGLYDAEDDYGTSYYFRGAVEDNYVEYAGYIWRIIRVNGDGSVRMIYDGTTAHANGDASEDRYYTTSAFNEDSDDNAHLGYMYGTITDNKSYSDSIYINVLGEYYYATSYTYDVTTGEYTLSGTMISGRWGSIYSDVSTYPYSCLSGVGNTTCSTLYEITDNDSSSAKGYVHTIGEAFDETNTNNSTVKTALDTFYEEKLDATDTTDKAGNKYSAYLSDTLFCNDRSVYSGSGYGKNDAIYYGYNRLYTNTSPVLTCTNQNDEFTVETITLDDETEVGNGDLIYPIGLITADEVWMAGGTSSSNTSYYLYMGSYYWTMTPYYFNYSRGYAYGLSVGYAGYLTTEYYVSYSWLGVRPVVNLSSDVYVYSGTGTQDDPYQVSLTKREIPSGCNGELSCEMLLNSTGEKTVSAAESAIEEKGTPSFSSNATTDEGLYAAEDDYGTSYYYRGAVEDNYVYFAGYYWRIIRVNGDGSVRIIMEDVLDYVTYNDDYDSPKYVGYTYGNDDSDEETMRENDNDSTIKQYLDSWYADNLIDYDEYLSDTLFCNDRTLSTDYTWSNFTDDLYGEFSSYQRLNNLDEYDPTLKCSNQLDRYTVSDTTVGNGYLTYPIGLITADEVVMAGNNHSNDNAYYYLNNGDGWWTMTPVWFDSGYVLMWYEDGGDLVNYIVINYGARPVVNLSSEVLVSGGDGTYDSPYELTLSS